MVNFLDNPYMTGNSDFFASRRRFYDRTKFVASASDGVFFVLLKYSIEPERIYYSFSGNSDYKTALISTLYMENISE